MKVQSLGHVVLRVRDRERAEAFYGGVLGLPIATRYDALNMTFFSLGDHHDFAVVAVGEEAPAPDGAAVGLQHVAFKIGDDLDVLKRAKADLEAAGLKVRPIDHDVTKSLYFKDPDGNGLEVYVDVSDAWRSDPSLIAQGKPLDL